MVLFDEMARPRTIDRTGRQGGTRVVGVRLTEKQYRRLLQIAQTQGITVSEALRQGAGVV